MKCLLHYFERISEKMPEGYLTVKRKVLRQEKVPKFSSSQNPIAECNVIANGTIEDSSAIYHADFANEYIGGGALQGKKEYKSIDDN